MPQESRLAEPGAAVQMDERWIGEAFAADHHPLVRPPRQKPTSAILPGTISPAAVRNGGVRPGFLILGTVPLGGLLGLEAIGLHSRFLMVLTPTVA